MVTLSELLEDVYRFYPRGWLCSFSPGFDYTPERYRLRAAWVRAADAYPTWKAMIERLRLGLENEITDQSAHVLCGSDSAYSGYACLWVDGHDYHLGFHVSFLGSYYVVHRMGRPGEERLARAITREIEATYPGYEPIPPDLGDVEVPDVQVDTVPTGKATVYDCLLSPLGDRGCGGSRDPRPHELDPASKAWWDALRLRAGDPELDE
jgi:hypothetical protein